MEAVNTTRARREARDTVIIFVAAILAAAAAYALARAWPAGEVSSRLDPNAPEARRAQLLAIARFSLRNGDGASAARSLEALRRFDEELPAAERLPRATAGRAALWRGDALVLSGRSEEARAAYEEAARALADLAGAPSVLRDRARVAGRLGRSDEEIRVLTSLGAEARADLVAAHVRAGRHADALALARDLLGGELSEERIAVRLWRSIAHASLGKPAFAREDAWAALEDARRWREPLDRDFLFLETALADACAHDVLAALDRATRPPDWLKTVAALERYAGCLEKVRDGEPAPATR